MTGQNRGSSEVGSCEGDQRPPGRDTSNTDRRTDGKHRQTQPPERHSSNHCGDTEDYVLDKVLLGNTSPISTPVDIPGTHIPLGLFDDIPNALLYSPGPATDILFGVTGGGPSFGQIVTATVNGVYTPAVSWSGEFVVWHAPGGATDFLWVRVS